MDRRHGFHSFLRAAGLLAAGYIAAILLAVSLVDFALYHPEVGGSRAPESVRLIRQEDGRTLGTLYLPNPAARYTIWHFYGNAENLGTIEPDLQRLHDAGFAVFAMDYPGYGSSGGTPGEKAFYAAAETAGRHLRDTLGVPEENTLLHGRSLGGGTAIEMATRHRYAGLILEGAFTSVFRVVTRWRLLPFDRFSNLEKMDKVPCPVLVMQAGDDEVVPPAHGRALFAAAPSPKLHLWVEAARHNDLQAAAGADYGKALREFADMCAAEQDRLRGRP